MKLVTDFYWQPSYLVGERASFENVQQWLVSNPLGKGGIHIGINYLVLNEMKQYK
jgi:hypothetical protein